MWTFAFEKKYMVNNNIKWVLKVFGCQNIIVHKSIYQMLNNLSSGVKFIFDFNFG